MTTTTARDLVTEQRSLYRATVEPALVDVPPFPFLQVDGVGSPDDAGFVSAVQGLYSVGYTLRFQTRADGIVDYKVPPLEGLWWADDMTAFIRGDKREWKWTLLLRVPDEIDEPAVDKARTKARDKAGDAVDAVRLDRYDEGHSAQVLHLGPFATEGATIERLHAFIATAGLSPRGPHHEIYMGDPRRTRPERLKTILRQPVA